MKPSTSSVSEIAGSLSDRYPPRQGFRNQGRGWFCLRDALLNPPLASQLEKAGYLRARCVTRSGWTLPGTSPPMNAPPPVEVLLEVGRVCGEEQLSALLSLGMDWSVATGTYGGWVGRGDRFEAEGLTPGEILVLTDSETGESWRTEAAIRAGLSLESKDPEGRGLLDFAFGLRAAATLLANGACQGVHATRPDIPVKSSEVTGFIDGWFVLSSLPPATLEAARRRL